MGVHVRCHVGFHVGFQLPGYGGGHHGKDSGWVPSLVSSFQDMDRVLQADLPSLGRRLRAVASPVESTRNLTWNPVNVPVALAPGGPAWSFPCWVEVLEQVSRSVNVESNLEPVKCPRGFGTRRFWPEVLPAGRLQ